MSTLHTLLSRVYAVIAVHVTFMVLCSFAEEPPFGGAYRPVCPTQFTPELEKDICTPHCTLTKTARHTFSSIRSV